MSKCSGIIGYVTHEETQPGEWTEVITEKKYFGDIIKDNRRIIDQSEINGHINISNNISIVSNSYLLSNLSFMRYITFLGSKWKITSLDIKPPRIIITIGGLYNG